MLICRDNYKKNDGVDIEKMMSFPNRLLLSLLALAFLSVFTVLLFIVVKCEASANQTIFYFLRITGYLSDTVVWLILLSSRFLTAYAVQPYFPWIKTIPKSSKTQAGIVFFLLAFSAFPLGNYFKEGSFFFKNWMWYFTIWMINLGIAGLLSLFLFLYRERILYRIYGWFRRFHVFITHPEISNGDYYFFMVLLAWTWISALLACFFVLGGVPHVQDDISQFFQARIFSIGRMFIETPAGWDFVKQTYILSDQGRVYSIYPPGYPLLLALGMIANAPQFVNPFISCINLILVFILARLWFSAYIARLSVLFLALSPFFIFMGSGFMNHPSCMMFLLLFFIFIQIGFNKTPLQHTSMDFIFSGFFLGLAFMTRPQTAAAFIPVLLVMVLYHFRAQIKKIFVITLLFSAGVLIPAAFFMVYNTHTTGSPFIMGYNKLFHGNPVGLGQRSWEDRPLVKDPANSVKHTPLRGFSNTLCNLNGMNYFLFGWPIPSLFFAFLLFFPGFIRDFTDYLCLFVCFCVAGIYFFFYYQDFCYGPRFFFETMPFWIFLSARGIEEIFAWVQQHHPGSYQKTGGLIYGFVTIFFLFAFCTVWIERIVVMSDNYWGTNNQIARWAKQCIPDREALVFIQREEDHMGMISLLDPRMDRGWIIARDFGLEENHKLISQYPGWPAYRISFDPYKAEQPPHLVLEKILQE